MARKTISLGDAVTPATVELGDQEYETIDLKRTQQNEWGGIQEKIDELESTDNDEAVKLFGQQLDLVLRPVGKAPTKAKQPSEVVWEAWEKEEIGARALSQFVMQVYAEVTPF